MGESPQGEGSQGKGHLRQREGIMEWARQQLREGEIRFTIESKAFSLRINDDKDRKWGVIEERWKKKWTWIGLGDASLRQYLAGLERALGERREGEWQQIWQEGNRIYTLEKERNKAGAYLRLKVQAKTGKVFAIILPQGKTGDQGWRTMVYWLQQKGIRAPSQAAREERPTAGWGRGYREALLTGGARPRQGNNVARAVIDGLVLQLDEKETEATRRNLEKCMVGEWRWPEGATRDARTAVQEMKKQWMISGHLGVAEAEDGRLVIQFENEEEKQRVEREGVRQFTNFQVVLRRWEESMWCLQERQRKNRVWVRIIGLPLHLWSDKILKKIGDSCGGFIVADDDTVMRRKWTWGRLLVHNSNKGRPSALTIQLGTKSYCMQLWWEDDVLYHDLQQAEEEGGAITRAGVQVVQRGEVQKAAAADGSGEPRGSGPTLPLGLHVGEYRPRVTSSQPRPVKERRPVNAPLDLDPSEGRASRPLLIEDAPTAQRDTQNRQGVERGEAQSGEGQ